ncbi:amino acid adenylation domain-containing protein [Clostridium botulinum]|nr:amino acid adenylation domain-containing protein [Clostridium botulinum]NFA25966.1 amino acid adenylation domain-containing protein [Clostridium botulinum]NFB80817.1 amino acid adenylation domain-containing protein [Clostridium botulinum]NFB87920.1 amino acid adenylation domain-containing protein [Clostridium botulinum]NFE22064.1 amino acid adenylation domain-containing protein [Clostridium botulinum]
MLDNLYSNIICSDEKFKQKLEYWINTLSGELKPIDLPCKYNNNYKYNKEYGTINIKISQSEYDNLITLNKNSDIAIYITLLSVFNSLISKYTGNTEVMIGSPVLKDKDKIVNSLIAIRSNICLNDTFKQILLKTKEITLEAYKNQNYPMNTVLKNIGLEEKYFYSMLNVIFAMENIHELEFLESYQYDLLFLWKRECNGIFCEIKYNVDAFNKADINIMINYYIRILKYILNDINIMIKDINLITEEEKNKLLYEFNDTYTKYLKDKTIQELFEEQVERTPDNIAMVFEDKKLTYRELNEKANSIARVLRDKGAKADSIVGIMVERSIEMIVGIIGILKSGGAYLPIDPYLPKGRILHMIQDSHSNILLTTEEFLEDIKFNVEIINLSNRNLYKHKNSNLEIINKSNDLAYVIYTSGSTGSPKGVMIEHKSINNLVLEFKKSIYSKYNEKLRVALLAPYYFDASVKQIFVALIEGHTLYITNEDIRKDGEELLKYYKVNKIDVSDGTPSHINMISYYLNEFKDLTIKHLIIGGDILNQTHVKKVFKILEDIKISNVYGPTECCVDCSIYTMEQEKNKNMENMSIGRPISNCEIYILDKDYKLAPIGVLGELCISGDGLARGYLNNPELTAEKFVDNPFEPGERMYKTGDLARWLPDGNIEFLGRIDNQVKIRGFRIELEEIENRLLEYEGVKEAVVVAKEDKERSKYLCAYIVSNNKIDRNELKNYLLKDLPEYMIPLNFVNIKKIPLTSNGKVDRKILENREDLINIYEECEKPRNSMEEVMIEVFKEVLGVENLGINHSFFDLGGDSIKAIRLISKLKKHGYKLEIKDLFKYNTIKDVSNRITLEENSIINQELVKGKIDLIPIQKWFFEKDFIDNHHWNQAVMLFNEEGFNESIIKKVFDKITEHHDALRIVFKNEKEDVLQFNRGLEGELYSLEVFDYRSVENYKKEIENKCNKLQSSINLSNGPLVKLGMFKTKEGDHLLIFIHHLVIDGVSWRILLEDFSLIYNMELNNKPITLQEKTNSFKEWSTYIKEYANSKDLLQEEEYWENIENTKIKKIPKDNEIKDSIFKDNRSISIRLSEEDTENLLRNVNKAYNTEINDILLTALGLTIKQWSKENKVLINLEGHGREEFSSNINVSRTIGWFTNQYPLVLDISKDKDISYEIKNTKETLRRVPNKGMGYGILRYIKNKWDNNINPEISFNYLGQFDEEIKSNVFKISNLPIGQSMSLNSENTYCLNINGMISNGVLNMNFGYNSKEYNEETIKEISNNYKNNLVNIINHCLSKEKTELTPTDLGDSNLTIDQLDILSLKYRNRGLEIKNIYSLTPMQMGMLFHALKDEESSSYFEQSIFTLKGEIDLNIFERSFNKVIERYDILRTVFVYENVDKPKQIVFKERKARIGYEDISKLSNESKENYIENFISKDKEKGFNLGKDLLIKISILKVEKDKYEVVWSFHHILMDGWCLNIIMNDFFNIYSQLQEEKSIELPKVTPYIEYIKWLEDRKKLNNEGEEYWRNYLSCYENVARIPISAERHKEEKYELKELKFAINKEKTKKLERIVKTERVTMNTIIQAVWGILLQRYNNIDDVVFGTVVSGRNANIEGIDRMVGLFINTIPVRIKTESGMSFVELIKEIQKLSLESSKYDYYPLAEIQSKTKLKNELINNIVVYENYYIDNSSINLNEKINKKFIMENMKSREETNYDLNLIIGPSEELNIKLSYNKKIYDDYIIEKISKQLALIIDTIISNKNILVDEIEIIEEEEKNKILYEFNDTKVDYPKDKTIQELFEEQVEKTPNNIAVVFEDKKLTYRELNEKANSLGRLLRDKGVKADSIVGIMVERSVEMIVGIMGILKSGGAYLPIDPSYPVERIEYMIEDAKIDILITSEEFINKVKFSKSIVNIKEKSILKKDNLDIINKSSDLAYVIYTSGSTGRPKGVMVEHKSLINLCNYHNKKFNIKEEDKSTSYAEFSFDASVWEVFPYLIIGATIYIINENIKLDIIKLNKYYEKNNITISFLPTPICQQFMEVDNTSLRVILTGGDKLNNYKEKQISIINNYGPTEATVLTTSYHVKSKVNNIPIGKPMYNQRVYILNNKKVAPIGVSGELCISGDGLARGYLNNPELTSEKFVDNPFEPGERMYRTGDLAKWLPDGNIEFLGRIDNQVKIRGFRIELEEIENRLLEYEGVKEAVVVAKEDKERSKYLCAYIVSNNKIDRNELKNYLLKGLPEYMIPSYFIELEKIPLTSNGKIDRRALPEPNRKMNIGIGYEAAGNELEEKLVKIWSEILEVNEIGINDNFFELDGNSLKAMMLVSKIYKELEVEVPLNDLFKAATIKELSKYIINKDIIDKYKKNNKMIMLNNKKENNIFAFPPLAGYGIVYKELSQFLTMNTLYGFDFIEHEKRNEEYIELITNIQKDKPYILIGYSIGGNLAFEVAKNLEKQGYEVSDIILLDSLIREHKIDCSLDSTKKEAERMIENIKQYASEEDLLMFNYIKENYSIITRKIFKYKLYSNNVINIGKIKSNIHLIASCENKNNEKLNLWQKSTLGSFKIYNGFGSHNLMMSKEYIKKNANIIRDILGKIE